MGATLIQYGSRSASPQTSTKRTPSFSAMRAAHGAAGAAPAESADSTTASSRTRVATHRP
ncbi:MAG: hypothetical protein U0802_19400 [Candidatus Binatia bacterium]